MTTRSTLQLLRATHISGVEEVKRIPPSNESINYDFGNQNDWLTAMDDSNKCKSRPAKLEVTRTSIRGRASNVWVSTRFSSSRLIEPRIRRIQGVSCGVDSGGDSVV